MKNILLTALMFLLVTSANTAFATSYSGSDIELAGNEYSDIEGTGGSNDNTWFEGNDSIWTAWANNWVEYTVYLEAGNWNIGINAINHTSLELPPSYPEFNITVDWTNTDLNTVKFEIPASNDVVNGDFFNYDIATAGDYTIRYIWTNDRYLKGEYDANIEIKSVFFDNTETAPVPEPATMLLFGSGLIGLASLKRKFKKA